ncbi:MAG: 2-hydroxyacyl-CoA dehydratase family protein [Clostridiales Family XIII bacterium]|nr:2-hydroxyacyl-CoA dehydratase family protein [Clostridia bacterium]MDY3012446.1 2-hydroxyacyl-CoA dehydratase family protein [Clostridiales Family XIII bacterium]
MSEEKKPMKGQRSVKSMEAAKTASKYQKEWFFGLQDRVAGGEPFAYINADVPLEILRAMDIPFVVNQWWAAICSAKQMSPRYFNFLRENGYRDDLCSYCATAFAGSMDPVPEQGPWGGLPRPTLAITRLTCDSQGRIFELLAQKYGAKFYPIENTIPTIAPDRWWEKAPDNWEELYESERLDAAVEELKGFIRFLEMETGRMFDENQLIKVMNLINEQEGYYKKARDLIADTVPAPVTIADTVNAVMQAQWQRGTQWAADHARKFYEEIKAMVDAGHKACPNEKIRLMWIGRGLWFNLGFYQYFEKKYGAAFIWSMYLAMGADAYIRNHVEDDPLRALAARFIGMEDFLHMPPWNAQWFVSEARHNKIDGVVYLVPENCMQAVEGSYFITKRLEDAGIPVLQLRADPVDARKWNQETMTEAVETFLQDRIIGKGEKR